MLRGPFRFHADRHVYTVGPTRVASVTEVVSRTGRVDPEWMTEESRQRGRAVHAATLHWDLTGEEPPLPPEWVGFLRAYQALRAAVPCAWRLLETPKVHRGLRFAGTCDRVGTVRRRPAVVELKTTSGGTADWHGVQLAGQDILLGGRRGMRRRLCFYLWPDGRYRVHEYDDPRDYVAFLNALAQR